MATAGDTVQVNEEVKEVVTDVKKETKDTKDAKPASDDPRPSLYAFIRDVIEKLLESNPEIVPDFIAESDKLNSVTGISTFNREFPDAASRVAYTLIHGAQRMYLVNSVLTDAYSACTNLQSRTTVFNELMQGVDWGTVNVYSMGGGPGCDVVGVLMWLHRFGLRPKISASVSERNEQWEGIAKTMLSMLKKEGAKTPQHSYVQNLWKKLEGGNVRYFAGSEPSVKQTACNAQADIVLLPFALGGLGEDVSECLQTTLDAMKPGALLVYLDHCDSPHTELINNLSYWSGLRRIYFMKEMTMTMPKYEKSEYLEKWSTSMEKAILRDSKCTAVVYKKPSGYAYDRRRKMGRREQEAIKGTQIRLKKTNPSLRMFRPTGA